MGAMHKTARRPSGGAIAQVALRASRLSCRTGALDGTGHAMSENFFYTAAISLALATGVGLVLAFLRRRRRLREDAEQRAQAAQAAVLEAQREAAARAAERAAAQEAARRAQEREAQAAAEREAARQRALAEQAAREQAAQEAAQRAAEAAAAMAAARAAAERRAAELAEEARRRAEAEARRLAPPPAPPAAPAAPRRPEDTLVMVADDSKVVRVKTSRLLAQHGYRVVLAEDGAQAAELIEQEVPLVLVTDVEMPGLDGFALTRHVRTHPKARDIAIIMITSADDRLKAAAEEAGVTLVLGKPYPEEALLDCIQRVQGQPA